MMRGEFLQFDGWEDVEKSILKPLELYGFKTGGSITRLPGQEMQLSLIGKLPKPIVDLIDLGGEDLSDYEGIDDKTKVPCHTFPFSKINKLLADSLGFIGHFKEIPALEQDETASTPTMEIIYLKTELSEETINNLLSEAVEMSVEILDVENDSVEDVASNLLNLASKVADISGNFNLKEEIEHIQASNALYL